MVARDPKRVAPAVLHAESRGAGSRLVLVHGFTQNRRCWGPLPTLMEAEHEVVRVDAPGHGRSARVIAGLWETARLLGEAGGRAVYLGYSMGGRLCLHLGLAHPDQVRAMVLVGATPGIEDTAERAARAESDAQLAARLERIGTAAFLDEWLDQPIFAGLDPDAACRVERLEGSAAGLAASLRLLGTGVQEPLWARLGQLTMPVLVLAGERDAKFAALGARMAEAIGRNATLALIPGAGHAAHLEQPEAFAAALRRWLRGVQEAEEIPRSLAFPH